MSAHGITLTGYCARWASGLIVEPLGTWDSTGQEQLVIESASDEWQGTLTATFWGPGAAAGTDMLMDGGTCIVPPEALAAPGNGTVTLRCTNAQGRRISVDLAYHSAGHAQVPGSPSEPTPDLWQQYVERVQADADRAEQASKDAAGSADAAAESAKQAAQATADIGEAKDDALEAIQQAHQAALDDIATDRQQALTDIEAAGSKQQSAITSGGSAALEAIVQVEQTAIGQVQKAGQTQQTAIEQAGQSWQQQIAAAGTAELGRWAPAIWDTAPLAAGHDIYAAEGAPMRVTQQGETQQQTTTGAQLFDASIFSSLSAGGATVTDNGDGSFTISGEGELSAMFLLRKLYTSQETKAILHAGQISLACEVSYPAFSVAVLNDNVYALELRANSSTAEITDDMISSDSLQLRIDIIGNAGGTIIPATIKPMLYQDGDGSWEPYTGGAPSPSPDYPQAIKGIDSPVTAQTSDGQTTTSISMDIGSPLYGDGNVADTVANDVPSGCDKVLVLDGSEDEDWAVYATATGGNRAIFLQGALDMAMDAGDSAVMAYSDRLPVVLAGATNNGSVGVGLYQGNIYIYIPGITDVAGFRAALAANPLKIWYKSTAYTEAADLHIDTVTRRWRMVELDGTEEWSDNIGAGTSLGTRISGLGGTGTGWTSVGKVVPATTQAQTEMTASMKSGWLYLYTQMSKGDLPAWLAAQKSAGTPVRVLYQLAIPEEYASDPHTLPALGSLPETVKATGQSTVEYSADTKHYIDAKFAALSAAMLGG